MKKRNHSKCRPSTGVAGPPLPVLVCLLLLAACGNLNPLQPHPYLNFNEGSAAQAPSLQLPGAEEKIVAAVYRFRDQTGQYEPSEHIASWSTAVTQGATSILLKVLEDSGWFVPIEREGISNLMNERQIIRSIRAEHGHNAVLPPLLYAGIMLEGGIIGYDSNIHTGGAGARYLGIGGSTEFRQDQVTVYLRAVSTQNSRILKTVHSSETILSRKVDAHVFRFVDENRILEGEAGYTVNEPRTLAVTRAIEKAVEKLVMEGIRDGLWSAADAAEGLEDVFEAYDTREQARTNIDWFGREIRLHRGAAGFGVQVSGQRHQGGHAGILTRPGGEVDLLVRLTDRWYAGIAAHRGGAAARHVFDNTYSGLQFKFRGILLPDLSLTPFMELGAGAIVPEEAPFRYGWERLDPYLGSAVGVEYMVTPAAGLNLFVRNRQRIGNGTYGPEAGGSPNRIWSMGAGLVFYAF